MFGIWQCYAFAKIAALAKRLNVPPRLSSFGVYSLLFYGRRRGQAKASMAMWKHKLQEALDDMGSLPRIIKEARGKLNEAVCFYLGDHEEVEHIARPLLGKPALCPSDLRMPYNTVLFEMSSREGGNETRILSLIYKNENSDIFTIVNFLFASSESVKWKFSKIYGEFSFYGKEIIGRYCETECLENDINKYERFFILGCSVAHITLMLLSCKNIVETTIPAPTRLNKKRTLKNKLPICEYKVLEIHPLAPRKASAEKQHGPSRGLVRVHLCRGHFKDYTPDKPLFGKATGRFWWQPSVRGEKKRGVLNKDYLIRG